MHVQDSQQSQSNLPAFCTGDYCDSDCRGMMCPDLADSIQECGGISNHFNSSGRCFIICIIGLYQTDWLIGLCKNAFDKRKSV